MASILEQYRIADFLEWHREGKLKLNPDFQRGSVWTPAARSFLIDTILRDLPIPKIYIRTAVDIESKRSFREVVDGQQRLRAIIDFADDKFTLTKRAGENAGLTYSKLDAALQQVFLAYPVSVGQLLNASDDEVLEVFARLNSYTVQLNPPEKRHARFQGDFKWAVRHASRRWAVLFEKYGMLSTRERLRMLDDSIIAECFGVLLEGVQDGGQPNIDKLYQRHDAAFQDDNPCVGALDTVLEYFTSTLASDLANTPLLSPPHFLMLFAALAHRMSGIPPGGLHSIPDSPRQPPASIQDLRSRLLELAAVIDSETPASGFEDFWRASQATTHRIASRRIRFPVYFQAVS